MTRSSVAATRTVADLGEFGLIDRIRAALLGNDVGLVLGIGDDTAAFKASPGMLLLATCDIQIEGRHFRREHCTPYQLGRRAAAINLSDIGAMGGLPRYALVSLALPPETEVAWVDELYRGLREELATYDASVIGGNVSASGHDMVIDVTLLGEVAEEQLLRRDGARPGDVVLTTGTLGESLLGRLALERGLEGRKPAVARVTAAHLTPAPRVREGRAIAGAGGATAMIDVSDGLAVDLGHLCRASGVEARLFADRVPLSPEAREVAALLGVDPLEAALHGGEDYELVFTCPRSEADRIAAVVRAETGAPVTEIGAITAGDGMTLVSSDGTERRLDPRGWDHFVSVPGEGEHEGQSPSKSSL
ncbi:MAG: thiamine-phosphate kinase [Dehalococcoidia bacterium]